MHEHKNGQGEPVGRVKTVGGYPDDSEHVVEWLCRHKDLKHGDYLYATPQPAEQQPLSHDWDDQDKCRRCGDRDWYASATCTPKQQPAPDVSAKRPARITEQDAQQIANSVANSRYGSFWEWYKSEGRTLLNELNADRQVPAVSVSDATKLVETLEAELATARAGWQETIAKMASHERPAYDEQQQRIAKLEAINLSITKTLEELHAEKAKLVEALRSILGWRELRSGNDFPVERIEEIAREALAAHRKQQENDHD